MRSDHHKVTINRSRHRGNKTEATLSVACTSKAMYYMTSRETRHSVEAVLLNEGLMEPHEEPVFGQYYWRSGRPVLEFHSDVFSAADIYARIVCGFACNSDCVELYGGYPILIVNGSVFDDIERAVIAHRQEWH